MAGSRPKAAGYSMIEILVALVVSLVTLMGAAGLVVRTVQQETEAVQRLQALTLVQDMVDRININRQVASCYSDGANGVKVGKGATQTKDEQGTVSVSLPTCTSGNSSENAKAEADLEQWHELLSGAAVQTDDNANIGAMLNATGCIEQVSAADREYRITVAWQGMNHTQEPSNDCGSNQYTAPDQALRRTVSLLVRVGNLQ
ncbi:type IV pilus modification protein PilV [Litorivivens sp.]|uniref:type IV pilus modification protein PilV n=1 Tax=Litorivivens sp. TaxID=2020868 RepID=UPI003568E7BC